MWPTSAYWLIGEPSCEPADMQGLATEVYARVCRTGFDQPGFCLVDVGPDVPSTGLRRFMVALKRALHALHSERTGGALVYLSCARFDQQVTTRLHRDGAPEESLLMLGYEASDIVSEIALADYSKCAFDLGITPAQFLERHNPMFKAAARMLEPYTTPLTAFQRRHGQLVLINNSMAAYSTVQPAWQGVLHTATVINPDITLRRVINSTMLAAVPRGHAEVVSQEDQESFITTNLVRRSGYDQPELQDDR